MSGLQTKGGKERQTWPSFVQDNKSIMVDKGSLVFDGDVVKALYFIMISPMSKWVGEILSVESTYPCTYTLYQYVLLSCLKLITFLDVISY